MALKLKLVSGTHMLVGPWVPNLGLFLVPRNQRGCCLSYKVAAARQERGCCGNKDPPNCHASLCRGSKNQDFVCKAVEENGNILLSDSFWFWWWVVRKIHSILKV